MEPNFGTDGLFDGGGSASGVGVDGQNGGSVAPTGAPNNQTGGSSGSAGPRSKKETMGGSQRVKNIAKIMSESGEKREVGGANGTKLSCSTHTFY